MKINPFPGEVTKQVVERPCKIYYDKKQGRMMSRGSRGRPSVYWTPQMVSELRRYYPTTINSELEELFGVSRMTIFNMARKLGLKKNEAWLQKIIQENAHLGLLSIKKNGSLGRFKKGNIPLTAFQKGHKGFGAKQCIDLETGFIYESRSAAAKAIGVHVSNIMQCIKNFGRCKGRRIRNYPNSFEETEIEYISNIQQTKANDLPSIFREREEAYHRFNG